MTKTILQQFREGVAFDMIYHGERRRVTEMGYQRSGVIWAKAGPMLPVVMGANGVYREGLIWLEPATLNEASARATPAPAQPESDAIYDGDPIADAILKGLNHSELRDKALYLMALNANQARTIDSLLEDAARYRHLVATCNVNYDPSEPWQLVIWEPATGEDWKEKLDAAIGAAMAAAPKEKP